MQVHNLDIPAIVRRLNSKPLVRIEAGAFVAYLDGQKYPVGEVRKGIVPAVRNARKLCEKNRLALETAS